MDKDSLAYNKPIDWFESGESGVQKPPPNKCYYCGVNMKLDCKKHSINCPNYCNDIPIGGEIAPLFLFVFCYLLIKIISKKSHSFSLKN